MKIMHLISGGDVGGAKTHVLTLLQELSRTEDVELVCFVEGEFSQDAEAMGIHTTCLTKRGFLSTKAKLIRMIRSGGYELLHCHGSKANVFGSLIRKAVGIPVITTVHSDPRLDYMGRPLANLTYGVMNRLSLPHRDGWVAVSDAMKELLVSRGFDADRIWPIYNGIVFPDKPVYRPRGEYLQSLGLEWNEENVIFGIAARISPVKDIETLVRAFAGTVKQSPNARLLIAGDGEQRQQMEQLAAELCPPGTVHFAGWVSDMDSFYHALDVNMLTSISETFPYAITEGARMYCATISTAVGGVPKVVMDGRTGFLVEPGDVRRMQQRMVQLATDTALRTRMGRAIYEKVKRDFSAEAMAAEQLRIYRSVLRRSQLRKRGRYGVMICGAYGRGNAGDDAILMSMIRQLRQEDPDVPICVMTRKPRQTSRMTGVSSVRTFRYPAAARILKKSDLYISGGGSLIQDATSTRSLLFYLTSIRQAKRCGCTVMMYGCGIGPVRPGKNQKLTARVLNRYVDMITLRDRASAVTLEEFGVTKPQIHLTADPALLLHADEAATDHYFQTSGLDRDGKYCLFCLRPWGDMDRAVPAFVSAAEYVWEKYGLTPVFYPMEPRRDTQICRDVAAKVAAPSIILTPVSDAGVICGLMKRMELVVAMRLHALIFACGQDTPVAAVAYDPKVSGFMEYLGLQSYVQLEDVSGESMRRLIDAAVCTGSFHDQAQRLRGLAEQNGTLAGQILRRARMQ